MTRGGRDPVAVVQSLTPLLVIVVLIWLGGNIYGEVSGDYEIDRTIWAEWCLADRASTIPQKSQHIDHFVAALEASGLRGEHDAVWLLTPQNGFDANLDALKTLQERLREIQGIDVTSFQYQTAIQQITAQEQGEATYMLQAFRGCWWKTHHFFLWGWVGAVNWLLLALTTLFTTIVVACAIQDWWWERDNRRYG